MEACDPLEHVNVYRRLPQQGSYWNQIALELQCSFSDFIYKPQKSVINKM